MFDLEFNFYKDEFEGVLVAEETEFYRLRNENIAFIKNCLTPKDIKSIGIHELYIMICRLIDYDVTNEYNQLSFGATHVKTDIVSYTYSQEYIKTRLRDKFLYFKAICNPKYSYIFKRGVKNVRKRRFNYI